MTLDSNTEALTSTSELKLSPIGIVLGNFEKKTDTFVVQIPPDAKLYANDELFAKWQLKGYISKAVLQGKIEELRLLSSTTMPWADVDDTQDSNTFYYQYGPYADNRIATLKHQLGELK